MGKLIYYDFRKEERRKEMQEIQARVAERLFAGNYEDDKMREQAQRDTLRYTELLKEENFWQGR